MSMPAPPPNSQLSMPNQTPSADWASDFHNLRISGPPPLPASQYHHLPAMPAMSGGWQNEFIRQQQTPQPPQQAQARAAPLPLQPYNQAFRPSFAPSFALDNQNQIPSTNASAGAQAPIEAFDESAFEAAFEQARADMELEEDGLKQDDVREEVDQPISEDIRIGSDTIPYPQAENKDYVAPADEASELAKTAGQLLNSVSHEQDQKFKESNFLALMRRIRDREVEVDGDEFREVSTNP